MAHFVQQLAAATRPNRRLTLGTEVSESIPITETGIWYRFLAGFMNRGTALPLPYYAAVWQHLLLFREMHTLNSVAETRMLGAQIRAPNVALEMFRMGFARRHPVFRVANASVFV